jgi:hypothetical protein
MFSGMTSHMTYPAARKAALTCVECTKAVGGFMFTGELLYKFSAGGMNAISPPRQWALNQMFPDDRTKIWTESKAAYALHNRAMGNPHNDIYKMQDLWTKHGTVIQQIKSDVPKKG